MTKKDKIRCTECGCILINPVSKEKKLCSEHGGAKKEDVNLLDFLQNATPDFIDMMKEETVPRYDISKPSGERYVGSFATFTPEKLLEMKEKLEAKKQPTSDNFLQEGRMHASMGKYEEAVNCYEKILEKYRNHFEAWFDLSCAHVALGRIEEAMKCLEQIEFREPIDPENADYKQILIHSLMIRQRVLEGLGRDEEALKCFEKISEIDPTNEFYTDIYD